MHFQNGHRSQTIQTLFKPEVFVLMIWGEREFDGEGGTGDIVDWSKLLLLLAAEEWVVTCYVMASCVAGHINSTQSVEAHRCSDSCYARNKTTFTFFLKWTDFKHIWQTVHCIYWTVCRTSSRFDESLLFYQQSVSDKQLNRQRRNKITSKTRVLGF